ncbi:MAG: signal peptidase I [Spirochaetia bacterium]|jgi:signal peptidase I|nr:signal peptidase I [Spirochaetia bacterium]
MNKYLTSIQLITEKFLTWRNIRKYRKYEKQKNKNPVLDWVEAFLWAAMVVLLINQYLFQAYQIPSGSMMNTLLVKDRIFVNKIIYGPELLPGILKIPGFFSPKRGEVVIFESPTYLSNGPLFDIAQRIIYMLTLSLIDIDKDQYGNPKAHFLIKRAVGTGNDRLRNINGNLQIKPNGVASWIDEEKFKQIDRARTPVRRLISNEDYDLYSKAARASVYSYHNMDVSSADEQALKNINTVYADSITFNEYRSKIEYSMQPHNLSIRKIWRKYETGWYIPEGWIFPLGDNRDNSRDGRYFGPVKMKKVLGKAMIKYWPPGRIGSIK